MTPRDKLIPPDYPHMERGAHEYHFTLSDGHHETVIADHYEPEGAHIMFTLNGEEKKRFRQSEVKEIRLALTHGSPETVLASQVEMVDPVYPHEIPGVREYHFTMKDGSWEAVAADNCALQGTHITFTLGSVEKRRIQESEVTKVWRML